MTKAEQAQIDILQGTLDMLILKTLLFGPQHGQKTAHLEIEIQENIEMGMSPEEARYAAIRSFGSAALSMERSRTMWGFNRVEVFIQDIKYGARMLVANRVFTAVAVLSLALGIG